MEEHHWVVVVAQKENRKVAEVEAVVVVAILWETMKTNYHHPLGGRSKLVVACLVLVVGTQYCQKQTSHDLFLFSL